MAYKRPSGTKKDGRKQKADLKDLSRSTQKLSKAQTEGVKGGFLIKKTSDQASPNFFRNC